MRAAKESKMNPAVSLALFVVGLGLVICFAERLVKGTVGMSVSFGVSTFLISVIFIGFDPENLAVGAVASYEGVAGIALGSIIGAAMVAIAFAFGITAMLAPMRFEKVSRAMPPSAPSSEPGPLMASRHRARHRRKARLRHCVTAGGE